MTKFLMFLVCAPIAYACFCRLWKLNPEHDKLGWGVMYLLMLAGVTAIFADTANTNQWPDLAEWLMLGSICLNLILTHEQWMFNNSPDIARKGYKPSKMSRPEWFNPAAMHERLAGRSK